MPPVRVSKLTSRRGTSTVTALLFGILLVSGAGGLWARSRAAAPRVALTPADTVVIFGPREFSTPTGQSAYHVESITASPGQGRRLLLTVDNGASDGSRRASAVSVKMKGQVVFTQSELDASGRGREYVELSGATTMEVTVSGGAGAYVTARLVDVADPTFLVFDNTEFIREDGKPVIVTKTFTLGATPAAPFYLCIQNGDPDGSNRTSSARVWLNGVEVLFPNDLNQQVSGLVKKVTLQQSNVLEVRMESAPGSKLTICAKATDVTPPVLTVATPANRVVTRAAAVDVTGTVQDETPTSVTVNGQTATRSGTNNAAYASTVTLAAEGDNTILVRATDAAGLTTDSTRTVIRDTEAPVLALASPADGLITNQATQAIAGRVQDRTKATVNVNGAPHTVGTDGSFGGQLTLAEGANFVTASATDEAGNASSVTNRVTLDTQAPVVTIAAPAEGTITRATSVEVRGTVADASATTVVVNGASAPVAADGSFAVSIPLGAEGGNTLTAVATDAATNQGSASRAVVRDTEAPVVALDTPAEGLITNATSLEVRGTVTDASATTVTVNGVSAPVGSDGSFAATVPVPTEGANTLTVVATDAATNATTVPRGVVRDTEVPVVTLSAPADGFLTKETSATVSGTVVDRTAVALQANAVPLSVGEGGAFSGSVPLGTEGSNTITLLATDAAGNSAAPSVTVRRDTEAPVLAVVAPVDGSTTTEEATAVQGTVTDASTVTLTLNGAAVLIDAGSVFSTSAQLAMGGNTLALVATDAAGNVANASRTVTREPATPPREIALDAPVFNLTVPTSMSSATSFLYSGPSPVQTGVTAGTINPLRVAGIRGRVLNRALQPLEGVTVSIRGRPEFGQTATLLDGAFVLAVNGGSDLTVDFAKSGYLPAQRRPEVTWQQWTILDDVILLQPDPSVTVVSPATATDVVVARGSPVTDADGTRRATVMFEPGTQATMTLPDSSTQILPSLGVRVTEFTAGESGPQSMPGTLPPTSSYTYAAQISVDEALAAGAAEVRFSKPVAVYVENFLGMPAGMTVPIGSYNAARGAWVAEPNGRVITVLSTSGGVAQIDGNGDGAADTPTQLAALGITPAEQQQIAATYQPGASLWRAEVTRTWPYDMNWGGRILGTNPTAGEIVAGCTSRNSDVIKCEIQAARQEIDIQATPVTLAYASNRMQGSAGSRTLEVKLTGATLPADIIRVELHVEVAGRHFVEQFQPATNLSHTFVWDGRDAFGRELQGVQPTRAWVSYIYPIVYQVPAEMARSFGLTCLTGAPPSASATCTFPTNVRTTARREGARAQYFTTTLGGVDPRPQGLGGFTPTIQHVYDPAGRVLHEGTGRRRLGEQILPTVEVFAGNGSTGSANSRSLGNGGPALSAGFYDLTAIAPGPDGSIYVAEQDNLRRITPDGIINRIAGTLGPKQFPWIFGSFPPMGDGGPALNAAIFVPKDLAVGPDGSVYFGDHGTNRVRRVGPDGVIRAFAGKGAIALPFFMQTALPPPADGGLATDAGMNNPHGIGVSTDGTVYIVDHYWPSVRRVGTDGIISVSGGNYSNAFGPDGVPAMRSSLNFPQGIAIDRDGSVLVADFQNGRVRRIALDGTITAVAGNGGGEFGPTGIPAGSIATQVPIGRPYDVAIAPHGGFYVTTDNSMPHVTWNSIWYVSPAGRITQIFARRRETGEQWGLLPRGAPIRGVLTSIIASADGSLYVVDRVSAPGLSQGDRIVRIKPSMPGVNLENITVASEDGSEIHVFDATGRHLRTLDALTKAVVYAFGYDAAGRLVTITDRNAQVTTIERDGTGRATAVVAATGQRTVLGIDGGGNLASMSGPDGARMQFGVAPGGLLTSITDARGAEIRYSFDAGGRLLGTNDPLGGRMTMFTAATASGTQLTVTSAHGGASTSRVEILPGDIRRAVTTDADSISTEILEYPDGRRTTRTADGTFSVSAPRPDPRFGMQAPLVSDSVTLPGGLRRVTRTGRAVTYSSADPTVVAAQVDSLIVNGRVATVAYDTPTRRRTTTTAAGRRLVSVFDEAGRLLSDSAAGLLATTIPRDGSGRPAEVRRGGRTWKFAYDGAGNQISVTDPSGRTLLAEYDAAGRVTSRTLPGGRIAGFTYDSAGGPTSVTPPGQEAHVFTRNVLGLLESYTPPSVDGVQMSMRFQYDSAHRLVKALRPDGTAIEWSYSPGGRVTQIKTATGMYAYSRHPQTGHLTSLTAPYGATVTYQRDGERALRRTWSGAVSGYVARTFDADFRVASEVINGVSSTAVAYQYDGDGFVTSAGPLTVVRDQTTGTVNRVQVGNTTTTPSYDGHGRLTELRVSTTAGPLFSAVYTRDSLGRVVEMTETVGSAAGIKGYRYDDAGRVVEVTREGTVVESYTYDANGNRTSATNPGGSSSATYDSQERLRSYGSTQYSYTSAGELLTKSDGATTTRFSYDAFGSLLNVDRVGVSMVEYGYDGELRRVWRKLDGLTTHKFLYADQLGPVAELDAADRLISRFVYGARRHVPDYMVRSDTTYRFVTDHVGSVRLVVNTVTGVVAQQIDYDTFGRVILDSRPGFQPFGFGGGLYDPATRLVRFGVRDYDAEVGRWTARDPLSFGGGDFNLYAYVSGDPVNLVDPTGMYPTNTTELAVTSAIRGALLKIALPSFALGCVSGIYGQKDVATRAPYTLSSGVKDCAIGGSVGALFGLGMAGTMGVLSSAGMIVASNRVAACFLGGAFSVFASQTTNRWMPEGSKLASSEEMLYTALWACGAAALGAGMTGYPYISAVFAATAPLLVEITGTFGLTYDDVKWIFH